MSKRQMKRMMQDILLGILTLASIAALMVAMFVVWVEHPGEQPISGIEYVEYVESLGGVS